MLRGETPGARQRSHQLVAEHGFRPVDDHRARAADGFERHETCSSELMVGIDGICSDVLGTAFETKGAPERSNSENVTHFVQCNGKKRPIVRHVGDVRRVRAARNHGRVDLMHRIGARHTSPAPGFRLLHQWKPTYTSIRRSSINPQDELLTSGRSALITCSHARAAAVK